MPAWIGAIGFDLVLGDVHSLKQKRSLVRPLVAELRKRLTVAAAETDHQDLHRRCEVTVVAVAGDQQHVIDVLDVAEQLVARRPEVELLSTRRRFIGPHD